MSQDHPLPAKIVQYQFLTSLIEIIKEIGTVWG